MKVNVTHKGDFNNTIKFLSSSQQISSRINLDAYGEKGVNALSSATPIDSGLTASSWYYEISRGNKSTTINFYNSNAEEGVPIAIIIQYGHATRNGGWVKGRDYINPAIQPIFDQITESLWKEVTSS